MLPPEEISQLRKRIQTYRKTLAHYLGRRAIHGEAHEPPEVAAGIREAQREIARLKTALRAQQVRVDDHVDDGDPDFAPDGSSAESSTAVSPPEAAGSGPRLRDIVIGGDTVAGDKINVSLTMADTARAAATNRVIIGGIVFVALVVVLVFMQQRLANRTQVEQARQALIVQILGDISALDRRLIVLDGVVDETLPPTAAPSLRQQSAAQQEADLRAGLSSVPLNPRLDPTIVDTLLSSGADLQPYRAFADSLAILLDDSESFLKVLKARATEPVIDGPTSVWAEQRFTIEREALEIGTRYAYASALLALRSLDAAPAQVSPVLRTMLRLTPTTIPSEAEATALLLDIQQRYDALIAQRRTLIQGPTADLDPLLVIQPDDTWNVVVGKAIALRKQGDLEGAEAAFARYDELFRATDPTAPQYARTAQTFTRQIMVLGVESGLYIYDVLPDNPAAAAGVQVGDVVISLNGQAVQTADDIEAAQQSAPADQPVEVRLLRLQADGMFAPLTLMVRGRLLDVSLMPI